MYRYPQYKATLFIAQPNNFFKYQHFQSFNDSFFYVYHSLCGLFYLNTWTCKWLTLLNFWIFEFLQITRLYLYHVCIFRWFYNKVLLHVLVSYDSSQLIGEIRVGVSIPPPFWTYVCGLVALQSPNGSWEVRNYFAIFREPSFWEGRDFMDFFFAN